MATLYIAGPMRGLPEFGFPEFDRAAGLLHEAGHYPVNPANHDRANGFDPKGMTGNEDLAELGFDLTDALTWDLQQVADSDGVAVLSGWENSKGARAEVATAHALGVPVATVTEWTYPASQRTYIQPDAKPTFKGEIRTVSSTGGEKGTKPERYDLIPIGALATVARLYGRGAQKYAAHNWRKGYEWSKSFAAMQRHATQFWDGEDIDPEMQLPHLASVVFHALALLTFMEEQPGFDDRYKA
ncbi:MAG: dATP/dGTP diphosphohydrolase domain-containing protein [Sphingomicrobium sp.]